MTVDPNARVAQRESEIPLECAPPTRSRLRILHAESNPSDAKRCESELEASGWPVFLERVSSREDFSVRIWSGSFDLILVDLELKGWKGIEAVETVRRLRRDIPVILVAGCIGEETVAEALHEGIADYVLKDRLSRLPLVVARVLKERTERQEKRRLSEERDRFFMLSTDLLCILDTRGSILQLNPAWHRTLGFEIEELVQQPLVEWVHPEDRPKLKDAIQSLSQGSSSIELETRFLAADGSCRWLQWRASCLPRQSLIYATARDVTETKVLQGQLLRAQRIESIGTLANGIAHDLNNVLTPILMAVDILQDNITDPRACRLLNTVQSSARHGADMVKQILTFSRGLDGDKLPTQLKHLVHQMRDFARDTFPRTIEIQTDVVADPWQIQGDSTQLHQVLLNLCVNARDAMPGGGKLVLSLTNRELDEAYSRLHIDAHVGRYTVLTVADTGGGIPPALLEKIFEPFFTTKEAGKGTGLGLSTVLGIVKGHGGFLSVYSEPNRGTRFALYFPSMPPKPAEDPPASSSSSFHPGKGEWVLVVDDESSFRDITRSILEKYNYRVRVAPGGKEALAILQECPGKIKLVITDMMMPGMDGTATLQAIQKIDPTLRMMATSGMPIQEPFRPLPQGETVPFLLKPYDTPRLLETVHATLQSATPGPILSP